MCLSTYQGAAEHSGVKEWSSVVHKTFLELHGKNTISLTTDIDGDLL